MAKKSDLPRVGDKLEIFEVPEVFAHNVGTIGDIVEVILSSGDLIEVLVLGSVECRVKRLLYVQGCSLYASKECFVKRHRNTKTTAERLGIR